MAPSGVRVPLSGEVDTETEPSAHSPCEGTSNVRPKTVLDITAESKTKRIVDIDKDDENAEKKAVKGGNEEKEPVKRGNMPG